MKTVLLLALLVFAVNAQQYRFDYSWVESAGGWMKYHAVPAVWEEARLRCHAEGAVLASPLTNVLKAAIITVAKQQSNMTAEFIYTGVHSRFSQGDYSSVEGKPLLRMPITWAPGQPNNYDNSESCSVMSTTDSSEGQMYHESCSKVWSYVCYKKASPITFNECGTSDPEYKRENGRCYKFHRSLLVWSEAYSTCVAEGGYLAIINDNAEMETIKQIFARHPANTVRGFSPGSLLLGFHDWGSRGARFMTIHGESLESVYHDWSGGQPDNHTSARTGDTGQYCGSMFRTGLLDDFFCNVPAAFICEMDPEPQLTEDTSSDGIGRQQW